jgi:hypothetical protein
VIHGFRKVYLESLIYLLMAATISSLSGFTDDGK